VIVGGLHAWEAQHYAVERMGAAGAVDGKTLYGRHCATCHQPDGHGMPGHYPALAGNGLVTMRDSRALLLVTLEGLKPARTAANLNPAQMPGFWHALSDAELAAIATYVRSSWGNQAAPVSEADVKAVRGKD
jgi:mono/diheme cytochrome c family protein